MVDYGFGFYWWCEVGVGGDCGGGVGGLDYGDEDVLCWFGIGDDDCVMLFGVL